MKKIFTSMIILVATLLVTTSQVKAADYYLRTGTVSVTSTSAWTNSSNGVGGTSPGSFSGTNNWHIQNRTSVALTSVWGLPSSATVIVGDGVTAITFSLTNTSLSKIGTSTVTPVPVNISANGTVVVNTTQYKFFSFNSLDAASTVIYSGTNAKVKSAQYGNLTVSVANQMEGDITTYGTLLLNGNLTMNGFIVNLYGTISCSGGGLVGDNVSSGLYLFGGNGGNMGTVNFAAGSAMLNQLYIGYDAASSNLSLGGDLSVTGSGSFFYQALGSLNLNGHKLTLDVTSDANFPPDNVSGAIIGSSASSLLVNGTIGLNGGTNVLYMDQGSSANSTLKVLGLNSSGNTLSVGNALNITDSLSVLDGTMDVAGNVTLKSTNALKARLSRVGATGSVTGNMNVETFDLAGSSGWSVIGPSGISGLTVASWEGQIPMTCNGCPNDPYSAGGTYFVSIDAFDETQSGGSEYVEMNYTDALNVGQGYWVYIGNGPTTTTDILWTVSGSVSTGTVNIPMTVTPAGQNGYNLLSNPFPSPISWTSVRGSNGNAGRVAGAIYIYNPDLGSTTSYVAGVSSNNGTSGACDIIPMGQGFYVQTTSAGNLVITENNKTNFNTSTNPLFKTASANTIGDVFRLGVTGFSGDYDETAFRFHSSATANFDLDWDAHKIFQTPGYLGYPGPYTAYTTISSKSPGEDYSVNSLPPVTTQNLVIPVLVKVMTTGQYTISPIDIQNIASAGCVTLKDKLTNTVHDLTTGPYVCTISDTTSAPRFELTICSNAMVTNVANVADESNNVLINQDQAGAYVKTVFAENTKAVISAYNVMGQKLMNDKDIEGKETTTYLNLNTHEQVVIIKVTTSKGSTVKRLFMN
ncbi:MAG: hypothetical protein JST26_00880 [Bacteroidetes bacterium]|nr:hypothetical protein [Bacteroidota bacterium]